MGLFDFFKKGKEIEIGGKKINLDKYYEEKRNTLFRDMDPSNLDYALIEHYVRYYDSFMGYKKSISYIEEDRISYDINPNEFGVLYPIRLENYIGKSNCIELIRSDIEKCNKVISEKEKQLEREEQEKETTKDLQDKNEQKLIPAEKKVNVPEQQLEFIKKLSGIVSKNIKIASKYSASNSSSKLSGFNESYNSLDERLALPFFKDGIFLEEKEREEMISKAMFVSGYPSNYVEIIYDILYMINHYEKDEAFNNEDLDVLVGYCKMDSSQFADVIIEWINSVKNKVAVTNKKV